MKVIFWGSPEFAVTPLEAVCGSAHPVVGVVCQPDRPVGRGRKLSPPAVKSFALKNNLRLLQPEKPRGEPFLSELSSLEADISVVVAYGHILRPVVLAVPPRGSINLHASLLPAYRGAAPIQRAVAAGEARTGLTVIRMDAGMDTGPVLAVRETGIVFGESAGELARRLSALGAGLLIETLDQIERGTLEAIPQPSAGISYAPKIEREEARLDWSLPAERLACLIRAFDPAPGAYCLRGGKVLKLFRPLAGGRAEGRPGEVAGTGEAGLKICCGDNRELLVREAQAEGKRRMSAGEYLRGAGLAPGEVLS